MQKFNTDPRVFFLQTTIHVKRIHMQLKFVNLSDYALMPLQYRELNVTLSPWVYFLTPCGHQTCININ